MKCRVLKGTVDGVAAGGEVDVADNNATRALIAAGELLNLHPIPEAPPPKAYKPASKGDLSAAADMQRRFDLAYGEAQERIRALEAENADLRAQLDAVRAAADPDAPAAADPDAPAAPDAPAEGEGKKGRRARAEG